MTKPRTLIYASGTSRGGGTGFEELVVKSREGLFHAEIVGVVSHHEHGGVRERAERLGVPFIHFPEPWSAEAYQRINAEQGAEFSLCSGWTKMVYGLDPRRIVNIHPGALPLTAHLYRHRVHAAMIEAYQRGEVTHTQICLHFLTTSAHAAYDEGPIFFRFFMPIRPDDTPHTLEERVRVRELMWQWRITNFVLQGEITWDGTDPRSLRLPSEYDAERHDSPVYDVG